MPDFIDASIHDVLCVAIAALATAWVRLLGKGPADRPIVRDLWDGLSLYPCLLMSTAVLSSSAVSALMTTNRVFITVAGLVALDAAIRGLVGTSPVESSRRQTPKPEADRQAADGR